MKRFFFLLVLILINRPLIAQEAVDYPLNWFIKLSPTVYTVNSVPATIDFQFEDDDFAFPDSISSVLETNSLWTYGANFDLTYLLPKDFTISANNYFGFGQNFTTYTTQLAFGREFPLKKFYIQPSIGIGFIYSRLKIDDFQSENKGYFEINNRFIYDDLTVRMKSRAFSVNPAVTVEYPIKDYVSLFLKITGAYTFGKASYLTFSGETDEIDEDGDYITAYENRNFNDQNVFLSINDQILSSRQSSYLHYNFNALQWQFGISVRLVETFYED
jgi:hypothetical protein